MNTPVDFGHLPPSDARYRGWRHDREDRRWLHRTASRLLTATADEAPEEIDPREWMRIEDQGQMGSCQGNALSTCCEAAYYWQTGGTIQFSRMCAYIESQQQDNISGDQGSTVSGGSKAAETLGLCLESTWPYPGRYDPNPPSGWGAVRQEAALYKLKSHAVIRSYNDLIGFLRARKGGVEIGIMWGGEMDSQPVIENYSGVGGGGHAISLLGYDKEGYIYLFNSWGVDHWGDRGIKRVSPRAISQMLSARFTECHGLYGIDIGEGGQYPPIDFQTSV